MKKIKIFLALFIGIFNFRLYGAAAVTHAFLALEWLSLNKPLYSESQKLSFLKGTLFNDIRYLAGLSRHSTHEEGLKITDIFYEQNCFEAGRKFHAWVDETRDAFVNLHGPMIVMLLKQEFQTDYLAQTYLKFIEDELLFNKYDWKFLSEALLTVDPEESKWHVTQNILEQWHQILIRRFTSQNFFAELCKSEKDYGNLSNDILCLWADRIGYHVQMDYMQEHMRKMIAYFYQLFEPIKYSVHEEL